MVLDIFGACYMHSTMLKDLVKHKAEEDEDEVLLAAINEIIKPYTDIENFNESLPRKAKAASDG